MTNNVVSLNAIQPSVVQTPSSNLPDGVLQIRGSHGQLLHQVVLSGDGNYAQIQTKIGQRLYRITIEQPIPGSDTDEDPEDWEPEDWVDDE